MVFFQPVSPFLRKGYPKIFDHFLIPESIRNHYVKLYNHPDLRKRKIYRDVLDNCANDFLDSVMRGAIERNSNFLMSSDGPHGAGKSMVGLWVRMKIQELEWDYHQRRIEIVWTRNYPDTITEVQDATNHDEYIVVMRDENDSVEGDEASKVKDRVKTLVKGNRCLHTHFIFVDITLDREMLELLDVRIRVIGYNEKDEINLGIVFNSENEPVGYVLIGKMKERASPHVSDPAIVYGDYDIWKHKRQKGVSGRGGETAAASKDQKEVKAKQIFDQFIATHPDAIKITRGDFLNAMDDSGTVLLTGDPRNQGIQTSPRALSGPP